MTVTTFALPKPDELSGKVGEIVQAVDAVILRKEPHLPEFPNEQWVNLTRSVLSDWYHLSANPTEIPSRKILGRLGVMIAAWRRTPPNEPTSLEYGAFLSDAMHDPAQAVISLEGTSELVPLITVTSLLVLDGNEWWYSHLLRHLDP